MLNKKYPWALIILLAICAFLPAAALADTHYISTAADLIQFSLNAAAGDNFYLDTVELTGDISLSGAGWIPIGGSTSTNDFRGTFDGKGHTISFTSPISGMQDGGLFGRIYTYGTVKNLRVCADVSATWTAGGIAAYNYGTILNCSFSGSVNAGFYGGGLAGQNADGWLYNSYNEGAVTATYAGGLAGVFNYTQKVKNCYSTGMVSGTARAGGLGGVAFSATFDNCYWLDTSAPKDIGDNLGSTVSGVESFSSSGKASLLSKLNANVLSGWDHWVLMPGPNNYPEFCVLSLSKASLSFGSAKMDSTTPAADTVTVTNYGHHPLTLNSLPAPSSFDVTGPVETILAEGAHTTFTLQPKNGLTVGTYLETVTLSDTEGHTASLDVSFAVTAAVISTALVDGMQAPVTGASPISFSSLAPGGAGYTVTGLTWQNGDGTPATLANGRFKPESSYRAFIVLTAAVGHQFPSGGLTPSVSAGTPQLGTVDGGDTEGNTLSFTVTFPNTAKASATFITVDTQPGKLEYKEGETLNLAGLTATIEYNDTTKETVAFEQFGSKGITAVPANGTALSAAAHHGQQVALNIGGLTAYTNTLTVTAFTYTVAANPASLLFGSLAEGYIQPEVQTVTVTNTGNQSISLYQPTAAHYEIGKLSKTTLAPMDTATFTVAPKAGLTTGVWNEAIRILGSQGVSSQADVAFTCTAPFGYSILSGDGSSFLQDEPGAQSMTITANGSIHKFTGLMLNGGLVDESDYDVSEGSTVVTLHKDYLDTLQPGTYTLRFQYTDGFAEAGFVVQNHMPATGDNDMLLLFGSLIALSLAAILLLRRKAARR